MRVELSDEARRYIGRFDDLTGVTPTDCLVEGDRLVFVVPAGEMAAAIGQGGETVAEAERRLDKSIELVEDADTAEAFVASTLAPAAVNAVTISEQNDRVAYVEVPEADRGVAIGADGANIETARRLAERHYDVDDVQLT
ncbi:MULTISPECIES: NusA-like transcription termination signal-binding factor [Halorubrum]|jgi:N utilization substance protein A|uniref:Probable transcription termination protein NusA n=1 Tax=Halorubrum tropicale TaxID=1765655 RepID=A0A0N0BRY7_9EURY|nr:MULTISPECIES: NusA-like transcription termination signal-binding factor [Halorubrum]KOX97466.1 transcription elongation factor NusA [Halorubrum tropicale]RLM50295.1 NusA-like transcription termination signal-binding factor [Halorubrum sp. Atlit-28R]TKX43146.1 NusA-like transcription termination signal-binding factor [Halorubrum sp. ARQ200]TKX49641.1 NusA-like transcription termination signal-binding factor [Halorubrum sp. ASP121]TKX62753.1 NusA-like transcription termination signal-binding 